jgi:hypothetical protein
MLRFLKYVKIAFWSALIVVIIMIGGYVSSLHQQAVPNWSTIMTDDKITSTISSAVTASARKSRSSAVKVQSSSLKFWGATATSSGTYSVATHAKNMWLWMRLMIIF